MRDEDPDITHRHGHMTAAQAGRAAARAGARRLLLTHFSYPESSFSRAELVALASAEFDGPVAAVQCDDVFLVGA